MKAISILGLLFLCSLLEAQTLTQTTNPPALPSPTPYSVVAQGANHQVWQRTTYEQAPDGNVVPHVHQYTELATGLNHLVNGQWVVSKEEIYIAPDGSSAAATNGQHQVYFPGNIYSGVVKLVTPNGQILESQPIGLSYSDGSNSVLLAVVTNSTGAILPSGNQVIYTNAFVGLSADLVYTYTKAGMEQDVVLRQQPPDPSELGLNSPSTRLQMLTEFIVAPQPSVTATTVPTVAGNLEDDNLGFGAMQIGHGKAFLIGGNSPLVAVDKRWLTINGRQFLIEEVPVVSIATAIDTLMPNISQTGVGTKSVVSKNLILPPQRLITATPKTKFLAKADPPKQGLVLDYVTMMSQTNYTFQGDMTYYISGAVNLAGTNTFEGGTSLKFATDATINIAGINCQTAPYRPVYFTGKDDDRTGEWVSGSTHNPNTFYANPALTINASGQTLSNFRIAYAKQAIATTAGSVSFYNGQFVNCLFGLTANSTTNYLRNVLFSNVNTNFNNLSSAIIDVQNGSFAGSAYFASVGSGVSIVVTNSVFANVSSLYDNTPTTFTGGYNGFNNATEFGAGALTNYFYPFQTAGAGDFYMATGCAFTSAGTANIDPTLLTNLANLTTYPPVIYSNVTITTNLILGPQARRDTNASPDLGYHYAPVDWFFGGVNVSSNITFTAGTAAGWFDLPSFNITAGWGISMQGQITAAFNGTVTAPCVWARYETVQEGGNGLWVAKDNVGGIASYQGNSYNIAVAPQIAANFTHFAEMWGDPNHFRDYYTPLIANADNCEFWGGSVGAYNNSCFFTNCLVYRMTVYQVQGYNPSNEIIIRNGTWHGGQVYLTPNNNSIPLSVRDCAFDGTTFTIQNYGTNGDYDYNAYTNGAAQPLIGGAHDVIVTNSYNWQTSRFGNYYLPSNSSLTNAGDVSASQGGLYHFTILTNQVPEGSNTVSIGYHYVATGVYGNPLDGDGDGVPDYLEDANGDGIYDSGDPSDWTDYYNGVLPTLTIFSGNNQSGMPSTLLLSPLVLRVTGTNGLVLTNAPLTFAVTQGGAKIATATNGTFAMSLSMRTDANGQASVFVLLPSTLNTTNFITATAWSGTTSNQVTFVATTIQGLKLWLRADLGVTNNGSGQISAWADQSGNTNYARQTVTARQPLYVTNAINGLPVVRFNRTNSQYLLITNFLNGTTQAEAFVVLKSADLPSTTTALWNMGAGTYSLVGYPYNNGQIVEDFGSTSTYTVGRPVQPLSQYHVYEVAGQTNFWGAWINGVLQYQTPVNAYGVNTSYSYLDLGCTYFGSSPFSYFSGDVAEVLIFNRTLSAAERWTVNSYLDVKYGLVTNAPPTPTNLVANAISTHQISLTWSFNLGTSSTMFNIARSTISNGVYSVVGQVADALSYVDTNLAAGTTYYYEVAAQNAAGTSGYPNPAWATTPTNGATLPFGNLALWLKADTGMGTRTTTNNVGEWFDQSGNYNNATQTTASHQPLYVTNAINGLPVVRFNRTNDQYLLITNFLNGTTQAEAFLVLKSADLPSTATGLWNPGAGIYSLVGYPNNNGQIVEDFGSTSTYTVGRPAQPLSQYHVYEVAGKTNFWGAWINGVLQYQTPVNAYGVNNSYSYLDLGCSYNGSSPFSYFSGDVAEVLIFNRTLSADERWTVNSYLALKYGLVTNVPPAPTNLVANAISTNQIGLTWSFNLGTSSTMFEIARSTTSNGVYTVVGQVANALSYVDTNLAVGTTYYYEVAAQNAAGTSGYSNPAWATTPPNGATLPFGNLMLWLKADTGVAALTTSYNVGEWFDQSGNYNNATQTTASHQPLYVTNTINGLPVVRFNPTNSQSLGLSNFLSGLTGAEGFVVLKAAVSVPGQVRALWQWGHGSGGWDAYPNASGQIVEDFGSTSTYTVGSPAQPLNQYHVYEVASQTNYWAAWINGILQSSSTVNTCGFNTSLSLGYNGNTYFNGDVAEVLIFNRTLNSSERTTVYTYLDAKYALVSSVPPTPTNLIADAISTNQISLTWIETLSGGATQISIERSTSTNGPFAVVAQVADALSYVDTNLTTETTYYYRVRAINLTTWSPYSSVAQATTLSNGVTMPLGSLLLWLKADTGLTQIGTNTSVNIWQDQSGNGNSAMQPTGSHQPACIAGALNGLPVIQFNGYYWPTNSYLALPNLLGNAAQAEAIIVLQAAADPPASGHGLWHFGTSGAGILGYPTSSGTIQDDFGTSPSLNLGVPAIPLTQPHIFDVYSKNNDWSAWINGILQYHTANQAVSFTATPTLGASGDYNGNNNFAGNIAELLIFNRTLTASERATVNGYLSEKYGLAPAVPPTPGNLVATAVSPTQVALSWNEILNWGITQISIERSTSSAGPFSAVAQVVGANSYVDTGLTAATMYYYRVRAINSIMWSGYSNQTNATTLAAGADMPLGSLLLWLKADSGLPEVGTNTLVGFWADQSGNNNNLDVSTWANQPLLVTNILNGEPVVRFNGSNSYFNMPNFLNGTIGADAFVVLKTATNMPSNYQPLWHLGGTSSGGLGYPDIHGNIADDFGSASANTVSKPAQPLTVYHLYEVSAQTSNWLAWVNGSLQFNANNNVYAVNPSPLLGKNVDYSGYTYFFGGDVAEILVFNRPLIGAENVAVGTYLFSKYNLLAYATNSSPPSTPTNVTTIGLLPGQLNVQWARTSTNETAFSIERKSGVSGVYQIVGSTVSGVTNFVDVTTTPANTNFYHIKAFNYFGGSGYSPEISPPSVSLTNWPGTILANTTNLLGAQAADANGTITSVGFYIGAANHEVLLGTATTVPYTANWVSGREGPWSLSALAIDSLGNSQFSSPVAATVYLDSNGDGIPDYLQVLQGNDPLNPWSPPAGDTNSTPPTINLVVPANATLLP